MRRRSLLLIFSTPTALQTLDAALTQPPILAVLQFYSERADTPTPCPLRSGKNPRERDVMKGSGLNGFRCDHSQKWRSHSPDALHSVFCRAPGLYRRVFPEVSLVVSGGLPGALLRAHVFRDRRLSPLFFAPLVQNQPGVPVHHGAGRHQLDAKGRALVGRQSPAPSPLFGYRRRPAFADRCAASCGRTSAGFFPTATTRRASN